MRANAGDWAVQDCDGDTWSVRDAVFRATYEHMAENRWRRVGLVLARPARHAEVVDTPEGPTTAVNGERVVRGDQGEDGRFRRSSLPAGTADQYPRQTSTAINSAEVTTCRVSF